MDEGKTYSARVAIQNGDSQSDYNLLWEIVRSNGNPATTEFNPSSGAVQVPAGAAEVVLALTSVHDGLDGANPTYSLRVREADGKLSSVTATITVLQQAILGSITTAQDSSCAAIGTNVKCWGRNLSGQLGTGNQTGTLSPVPVVGLPPGTSVKQISLGGVEGGGAFGCALTSTGAVYCWGANGAGQLGDGTNTNRNSPVAVATLDSGVTHITTGTNHACAIKTGSLYCWGSNVNGQLGLNDNTNRSAPIFVQALGTNVLHASAGEGFTCAVVLPAGSVKCWGSGENGRLGNGATVISRIPVDVLGAEVGATAVSVGNSHACALIGGGVKCWGNNASGQLGDNTMVAKTVATQVMGLAAGSNVTSIAASWNFTCAIAAGVPRCWGLNTQRQVSDQAGNKLVPTVVSAVLGGGFSQIAAGVASQQACAFKAPNAIHCWGEGDTGALGTGAAPATAAPSATPINF